MVIFLMLQSMLSLYLLVPVCLEFPVNGARYSLEIAKIVGAQRAYLKGGSPSCDREGVTGEILKRGGIKVIRVP